MLRLALVLVVVLFCPPCLAAKENAEKINPIEFIKSKSRVTAYVGNDQTEFVASTEMWFYNFPLDECDASITPEKDFFIVGYSCPASYGAQPIHFTLTSATGQNELILAKVDIAGKKLSREQYLLFIKKPFDYGGSYQTMLTKPFDVNIVDKENAITRVGSLRDFLESNERKSYQCYVIRQADPDYVVGCTYSTPKGGTDPSATLYYKFKLITNSQLLWVTTYRNDRTEFMGRAALKQIGIIFDLPNFSYE